MNTTETVPMATERQVTFGAENGLDIGPDTPRAEASELISKYIADHPWSDEEKTTRHAALVERMRNTPPSEGQVELIQKITKGKYVPKSMAAANAFFGRLRKSRLAQAA